MDYICSRDPCLDFHICTYTLEGLSDHCVLSGRMKFTMQYSVQPPSISGERPKYKWIGDLGDGEVGAASAWARHTNSAQFITDLTGIVSKPSLSVDDILAQVEAFVLEEGVR